MRPLLLLGLLAASLAALDDAGRERARAELATLAADSQRLSRAFNLVHEIVGPSVVSIRTRERQVVVTWTGRAVREVDAGEGSGFVIASDASAAWILTNAHVVVQSDGQNGFQRRRDGGYVGYDRLRVVLHDNREADAQYVGVDVQADLAVIRIPVGGLPAVAWADSDQAHVGDWVVALGYPLGVGYSASAGIVSATDRSTGIYEAVGGFESFIQTDTAINPGNSGGPLVDLQGRILGVNANIVSRTGANIGLGFAIPSNIARRVADDLRETGQVRHGTVGVRLDEIDAPAAQSIGLPPAQAVRVAGIDPLTPAESAGIRTGDIVLAVNSSPVASIQQFRARIASRRPGDRITLTLWRDGSRTEVGLAIADRADIERKLDEAAKTAIAQATPLPNLGCRVLADAQGLLVVHVEQGGLADQAGMSPGDRILAERELGKLATEDDITRLSAVREGVIQVRSGRRTVWLRFRS
jgi:S1-C subfamily serine protease